MFSLTKMGMNLLPLWTARFRPTNSGMIIDRRDQVRIRRRSSVSLARSTLVSSGGSTNGPFFNDRAMLASPVRCAGGPLAGPRGDPAVPARAPYLARRRMRYLSVRLLLRVLNPLVGWPHGLTGCRPPEVLPSPPPCGWSIGFIETPRLVGRMPSQRLRPA